MGQEQPAGLEPAVLFPGLLGQARDRLEGVEHGGVVAPAGAPGEIAGRMPGGAGAEPVALEQQFQDADAQRMRQHLEELSLEGLQLVGRPANHSYI